MTDSPDDMAATPPTPDVGMTPAAAAAQLGISERTVQRRLKQGTLKGYKVDTGRGEVWRVTLDDMTDTAPVHRDVVAVTTPSGGATTSDIAEFAHAVIDELRDEYRDELARLRQDNQQLAGQVGFMQARIHSLQVENEQLHLLMAPKEEAEPTDVTPPDVTTQDPTPDWQGIAQALEERVKRLEETPSASEQPRRSWWKRLWNG